ncbi:MAG TPA: efflux RND transporter periplasmic adaptor subunit [Rhizomicrobium sp.]
MVLFFALLLLAACGGPDDHAWLGYAEGDSVFISAPAAGWVARMDIERGTVVHKGQVLFVLDDTQQQAARDQAAAVLPQIKAQVAQAQATLELNKKTLDRQIAIAKAHAGVPTALDQSQAAYTTSQGVVAQLQAQADQAQAALGGAQYTLSQREIVAYVDGTVQDIYFRQGEYAPATTPIVSILPAKNIYARFFVPETEFAKVHLGDTVQVTCDGCKPMAARVTFIAQQQEFTPPVIFSVGNREKLVFKLEARAANGLPLHPGQPIEVHPR